MTEPIVTLAPPLCAVHYRAGPQADPDYFTAEDIQTLYSTAYKIHHNS